MDLLSASGRLNDNYLIAQELHPSKSFPVHQTLCTILETGTRWYGSYGEESALAAILEIKLKLKLIYHRQSVGQSVLVSGAHLRSATNFFFSLKFPSDSYGFVVL
jgi:hypothetical protein